jgi:DNA polymerase III subunit beta
MKIIVAKSILENILISSQPFLEKKDTSQITSHLYIQAKEDTLLIKATDYEIGLQVSSKEVKITEPGEITANGKKLFDIIRILKEADIILEAKNNQLHISQANSNFKLPAFTPNEFPQFPQLSDKSKININSLTLIQSLKKITPAIDTNNPKFELNGALIDITNQNISFVSTDTRRLAIINIPNTTDTELSLIIPKKAIIEIQKLFFENIELYYDNTYLIIQSEQFLFFTKLINGKFPQYSRIIPKETLKSLLLPKTNIIEAIKQVNTISNDMKITIYKEKIVFESLSNDNIEAKTEIAHESNFKEPFTFAANSRYILDFLSQTSHQEFTLGLNDSNQPFILENENFKTVVMPIVI